MLTSLPWNRRGTELSGARGGEGTMSPHALLTTERRDELLHVARTKRISWVEGMGIGRKRRPSASHRSHGNSAVLECVKCAEEMIHFMEALEIAPATTRETTTSTGTISILDEIAHNNGESLLMDPAFRRAYNQLLDVLKHAEAADLVHTIQTFLKSFQEKYAMDMTKRPASHFGEKVHLFITHLMHLMQSSALVQRMERLKLIDELKDPEWQREVLEAFLMEKLHATVFHQYQTMDNELHDRIASLSFLSFEHLDITATSDLPRWQVIEKKLAALSRYLSPRRQMTCILHVCQELTHLLRAHHGRYPGADEFLPALIYTILKANPPNLHSIVHYIQTYRHPSKLLSEPGYFFTHIVSSVSFLEQLDDSGLTITPEEFQAGLAATTQSVSEEAPVNFANNVLQVEEPTETEDVQFRPLSILDVRARRVEGLAQHVTPVVMVPTVVNPSFVGKTADELRVNDIPKLLDEYKLLHRLCRKNGEV
ncbi:hypothetical protein THRCLA_02608 [Thraustotheca clavata]|uniref:VPS9 domain-containing protein n=1 Tax=Thraustotheca clavata TaxID=74557 RepID=A0A1W0A4L5_9STRA|nr:hypothetical protein THRCLA_02608 [Thraustotheca clavata]